MEELARPSLFFDGRIYRLTDVNQADLEFPTLMFSDGTYFQAIHWAESVCHELATLPQDLRSRNPRELVKLLPIRSAVSSRLFDAQSRVLSLAINTITLIRRADGKLEFILHKRDNRATATFAGHYMVSPIGIFQPATQSPYSAARDCNLWLNIMREFSEEILGHPEADGSSGVTINYELDSPYVQLERARQNGQLRIHYMGLGMDPMELSPQMLTAMVIDQSVFDDAGWSVVERNTEGLLVGHSKSVFGLQFTRFEEQHINDLVTLNSLSAASQACITLAWRHRESLLAPTIGDFL
ncbi:hypothetical protein [Actinomadura sp. WMMA1423]|uniref:hypothetical protein n=1 Tax=Actinomadura sp. WMMA1423 TaxID=2591108 RepID=UPI001146E4AA|nr:hypothetical protein [Actinomadura sp. WMMA1423]